MTRKISLAEIAVASTAAGFGLSAGRSGWNWFQKNYMIVAAVVMVIAGGALAGFWLRRGTRHNWFLSVFVVLLPSLLILAFSVVMAWFATALMVAGSDPERSFTIWPFMAYQATAFVLGMLVAEPGRRRRERRWRTEDENIEFLANHRLTDVGGKRNVWTDGEGRELALDDHRDDALVFHILGKRGKRAYIDLDEGGRMMALRYS